MKKNRICTFNLDPNTISALSAEGLSIFNGDLGKIVKLKYPRFATSVRVMPRADIPKNLHEYDKIIIDLTNQSIEEYESSDHIRKENKSDKDFHLICYQPQTIFDPRALILSLLEEQLVKNLKTGSLLIIFCSEDEIMEYRSTNGHNSSELRHNLYSFLPNIPDRLNEHGEIVKVAEGIDKEIYNFIRNHCTNTKYHVKFNTPYIWHGEKNMPDPTFTPLMYSQANEIVSFYRIIQDSGIFFLPDILNKTDFLNEFLSNIAPTLLPKLFPEQIKNKWLEDPRYSLSNQKKLLMEKGKIIEKYKKELEDKDLEIESNNLKYSFLKDLLTETDKSLVAAILQFVNWIGFETAIDADSLKEKGKVLEEDIQIETPQGLIIIEVKGIGGTSTDSDCSQIGKVRYRRAKERNKFDVYPLYIVNHQRHIPAAARLNPPFSQTQINDAENDHRGLLTTWQLFNLFSHIEAGVLTKEEVRNSFFQTGYIDFIPTNKKHLGIPSEYFVNNTIVILNTSGNPVIKIGDKLLVVYKDNFRLATVQSIQINGKDISNSIPGEIGLKLDISINKGAQLYL